MTTTYIKENHNNMLLRSIEASCKKIAPLWSLENFVAVNPYLGLTGLSFNEAAEDLSRIGDIQMTLPISFYIEKIRSGEITAEDLKSVVNRNEVTKPFNLDSYLEELNQLNETDYKTTPILTAADIASTATEKDWNRFMVSRISNWASAYFDVGQALWNTSIKKGIFSSWMEESQIDYSPEIMGLKGFRKQVTELPKNPTEAIARSLEIMGINERGMTTYFHRLLLKVGGWSAYAARLDWQCKLEGKEQNHLHEFLAILVCWEACLYKSLINETAERNWRRTLFLLNHEDGNNEVNKQLAQQLILQEAFDRSKQRELISKFKNNKQSVKSAKKIKAQAVFCIDVRSEVYRRNLELVDNEIETLGFAGFFAFPINYVPLGHEEGQDLCPALLTPSHTIKESIGNDKLSQRVAKERKDHGWFKSLWKSFKSGAVSCFGFVSPLGLSFVPKLFSDSFGWTRPVPNPDNDGLSKGQIGLKSVEIAHNHKHDLLSGIPLDDQIKMAKNALGAMSLKEQFGEFVLIVGHGASTVNNPHATGLDCGACGGHSGEANAKVAAAVLNNPEVREVLGNENPAFKQYSVFLACLHNTTTDEVSIYNEHDVPAELGQSLEELKKSLKEAGKAARLERSNRMEVAGDKDKSVLMRSKDWSQIRPEWGLAGCHTFVVAPRERTKDIDLKGQSFLHSYNWRMDEGFKVLELIMTAPMVVTSWINLQYYGSTVDNKNFGSGNKTLHNVTAGLGVLEGYSGDLRTGLPLQSVHDGEKYQHEPLRLKVVIEAPIEVMNDILSNHASVKDLCDNEWIHLFAMNDEGQIDSQYKGNLNWEKVN